MNKQVCTTTCYCVVCYSLLLQTKKFFFCSRICWKKSFNFSPNIVMLVSGTFCTQQFQSLFWPQIRREHSLNLSILLSEGKETNKDSLSNGEWTGKSSMLNCVAYGVTKKCDIKSIEMGKRNESLYFWLSLYPKRVWGPCDEWSESNCWYRVELFGNAAQIGR